MHSYAKSAAVLAAAAAALWAEGPLATGVVVVAALYLLPPGKSAWGDTPLPAGARIEPGQVRRYREAHPGTTISAAIAALNRH